MANYKKWVALSKFSSTLEKTTLDLVIEQKTLYFNLYWVNFNLY